MTAATNAANTLNGTNITPGNTNQVTSLFGSDGTDDNKSNMGLKDFAKLHNLRLSEFNGDYGNVLSRLAGDDKAHAVLAKVVFKQDNNSDTHWVGVNSVVTIDGAKYLEIAPSSGNDSNSDARKAGWKFVDGKTYVPISDVRQIRVLTSPVPEGAR